MSWWVVAAVANVVILFAYVAIFARIIVGVVRGGQLRTNPLAVATSAIFLTCAVHHGVHSVAMVLPAFGASNEYGGLTRLVFDHWYLAVWDLVGAGVGIWYWMLRGRYPALVRGAAVFEDLQERRRQALDIHDNVVQGVATAKLALELGDADEAVAALDRTMEGARRMITDLIGDDESGIGLEAGDLRRHRAAAYAGEA